MTWQPATRYPDPAVQALDPRFAKYMIFSAAIERIATGMRWAEGPVWFGDQRCLLWSDIPNNRVMRWDEQGGNVTVFRQPSNFANGHTRDRQGRLLSCEHGSRSVTRTEYDGRVTVILDKFDGKRLNSPNDIVVKSDDSIWFTDPPFGILGHYEGHKAEPELPTNIYRVDGKTGRATVVASGVNRPNGLCFSPDEKRLYVVESGAVPPHIRVFDVSDGGDQLFNDRVFYRCKDGERPDGFRCDADGNLWAGWGMGEGNDGVRVFAPDGTPIGHITLPERCANLCFGGVARNRLFMTASQSVYSLYVNAQGAQAPLPASA
ncbi:SMP-30/gluconolactonase/LRE family protein [Variovorax robiniae]|uniref:SMP-30/gluconolactonase/LRE family protein n=1 Tax=Variovorax robiniae TaxID=1836199 RepID=A0ABU8X6R0_9BURK